MHIPSKKCVAGLIMAGKNHRGFLRRVAVCSFGILAIGIAAFSSQSPRQCTDQEAQQKSGVLTLDRREQAERDVRMRPKPDPAELKNTEQAIELLKQSLMGFRGLEGRYWHDFFDQSPTSHLRKYAAYSMFFDYYCVPVKNYAPDMAGTIRVGDETGTSIHIFFNSLGEFVNELLSLGKDMAAANGRVIFELPSEAGEWKGHRLFTPNLGGERSEAVILTTGNRFPFKPVSRDQFLLAREKIIQKQIDEVRSKLGPNAPIVATQEKYLREYRDYHASMSPAELKSQAIVIEWSGDPNRGRIFAKDAEHGKRLVVVDPDFIDKSKPRTSVQLMVLFWRWEEGVAAKREMIQRFKQNFDVVALEKLLSR